MEKQSSVFSETFGICENQGPFLCSAGEFSGHYCNALARPGPMELRQVALRIGAHSTAELNLPWYEAWSDLASRSKILAPTAQPHYRYVEPLTTQGHRAISTQQLSG